MRRRERANQPGMSLFPFLAVLICMMGALIVLLVMVVEQARASAANAPREPAPFPPVAKEPAPTEDPLAEEARARERELRREQESQRDEHIWRKSILETERQEKTNELAKSRLELGHLEDHIRQLEQQWKVIQEQVRQIEQQPESTQSDDQLAALKQQQQQLAGLIQQRKQEIAQQPKSFAILPYEGPNGTRRRPIYIECTAQGIVIQPAGVTLTAEDLRGPGGPGNPLDAALRAVREYWRETGVLEKQDPYPLVLVRPDGVDAYSVARASLSSWDDEFGYELVGADKPLAFPPVDEALVDRVKKAVALAKERQQLMASAMPKAYQSSRQMGAMRASRSGGFEPVHGEDDLQAEAERVLAGRDPTTAPEISLKPPANAPGRNGPTDPRTQGSGPAVPGGPGGQTATGSDTPVAATRGSNWALLNYTPGATAWSRPVRILCLPDRLVVLQREGDTSPSRTVMTNGKLHDKMDAFAELVRKHVEGWGVAPARGYWKPMLFVDVGPGGETAFAQLVTLLKNSGFEIRRDKQ